MTTMLLNHLTNDYLYGYNYFTIVNALKKMTIFLREEFGFIVQNSRSIDNCIKFIREI